MDGARIDHINQITDSLIGKNVILKKDDNLLERKTFVLGDSSQVML